jgi:hypothetical protein
MNEAAPTISNECDELRVNIERLRTLLESLLIRGLRACGPDELARLGSYAEHLDRSGAGHVAGALAELQACIEKDDRASARALLRAQMSVRLLERLLTLRVVKSQYEASLSAPPAETATEDEDED